MILYCAHCRKQLPAELCSPADNPHFPFCSDRCKMADLYSWLDEQYRIPAAQREDDPEILPPSGPPDPEDIDGS